MKRKRKVKIIEKIGKEYGEEEVIRKIFEEGEDVLRINMSKEENEMMRKLVKRIRNVEKEMGRKIGIMEDIKGKKMRVGKLKDGKVDIVKGKKLKIENKEEMGDEKRVLMKNNEIMEDVEKGNRMLIDEGKMNMVDEEWEGK